MDNEKESEERSRKRLKSITHTENTMQQRGHGCDFLQHLWDSWEQLQRKHICRMDSGLGLAGSIQQKSHRVKEGELSKGLIDMSISGNQTSREEKGVGEHDRLVRARQKGIAETSENVPLAIILSGHQHIFCIYLSIGNGHK